ncbi:MAG: helix-turn-helix domain-containing protein [Synergistaceae bacterium]|jgi:transposase|nr:helix-turn-helix domain-containing protein [Synergistaceae bacterium]
MNRILSEAYWRQRVAKDAMSGGKPIAEVARIHHVSRMSVYRWVKRYDGRVESLCERSHRPRSHPNEHTPEEKALIRRAHAHRGTLGLVCLHMVLTSERGYRRSMGSLCCAMRRMGLLGNMTIKLRQVMKNDKLSVIIAM